MPFKKGYTLLVGGEVGESVNFILAEMRWLSS